MRGIREVLEADTSSTGYHWRQRPYLSRGCLFRHFGTLYIVTTSKRYSVSYVEIDETSYQPTGPYRSDFRRGSGGI